MARKLDGPAEVEVVCCVSSRSRSRSSSMSSTRASGTDFNQADQLFFDQIVEAAMGDDGLRRAAEVNPGDKFELLFKNVLERLFVDRMDQNEDIFVRFMNDVPFQKRW